MRRVLYERMILPLSALLLRNIGSFPGRFRFGSLMLRYLRDYDGDLSPVVIRTQCGFRFNANRKDWLGQYVYLNGIYEPETARLFADIIKRNDIVLDIGANVGFFSLLSATLVGPGGRVFAFEPIPSVLNDLTANVNLNAFTNIEIVPKAASDRSGSVTIFEGPDGHKGTSSLRPLRRSTQRLTIDTIALDEMFGDASKVRFIKIDVEGAELLVIMGMTALIERDHPTMIIEFTDAYLESFGHTAREMAEWLYKRSYELKRITDIGLVEFNIHDCSALSQFNVLATHRPSESLNQETQ